MQANKTLLMWGGGLESVILVNQFEINYVMLCNYGQAAHDKQLEGAKYYANKVGAIVINPRIDLGEAITGIKSSEEDVANIPYRNASLAFLAASYAKRLGVGTIYIGAVANALGYDGTAQFVPDINWLIAQHSEQENWELNIVAPLASTHLIERVSMLQRLNFDVSNLWSCDRLPALYRHGTPSGKHCGECPKCLGLKEMLMECSDPNTYGHKEAEKYYEFLFGKK